MFCTQCGASNKDDAQFCINCNESLGDPPIEEKLSRLRISDNPSSFFKVRFLHPLFDFSFRQRVTMKMIKFFYLLSVLSAGLLALSIILAGFSASIGFGIFALLIGAPVAFLLTAISIRLFLEMVLVVFRMADHAAERERIDVKQKPESRDGIEWNV